MTTTFATAHGIDANSIGEALETRLAGSTPALVMAFASTTQSLASVCASLQTRFADAVVLGASTAGEFTEASLNAKGTTVAVAVAGDFAVRAGLGRGVAEDPEGAVRSALEQLEASDARDLPHRTAILLLDPLVGRSEEVTLWAGSLLGEGVALAGGAAGDDLAMKETFVACGSEHASDAVVIAEIRSAKPLAVGVAHGHHALSDELEVTAAEGATVQTIGGRPAWDVWVEHTRAAAKAAGIDVDALPEDEVGAYLLRFEAGLQSGEALKIRAPLSKGADGSLNFACGVPAGATFRITESSAGRQVDAAIAAAKSAGGQLDGHVAGAIVFDCICRNLILGEQFGDAVQGMSSALGDVPLAGFETYGEIALAAGDMSGFHNTTTVVLAFPT